MISQKLLVLLQNFSKPELRGFHKFLQSSFHNENQDLVKLFKIIQKIMPSFNYRKMWRLEFLPTNDDLKKWSIEEIKQSLKKINEEIEDTENECRLKHITDSKIKVLAALAKKEKL